MTRILFLHSARDRQQAAASWLLQRSQQNLPAVVYLANDADLDRFDRLLWTQSSIGFIPHCRAGSHLQSETPITLTTMIDSVPQNLCMLNLADAVPPDFNRFDELVEIVSTDDTDRLPGRERFRFYREQGYELQNIDISKGIPS